MKQMSVGCTFGVGKRGFLSDGVYFLGEVGGEIIKESGTGEDREYNNKKLQANITLQLTKRFQPLSITPQ